MKKKSTDQPSPTTRLAFATRAASERVNLLAAVLVHGPELPPAIVNRIAGAIEAIDNQIGQAVLAMDAEQPTKTDRGKAALTLWRATADEHAAG